MEQLQLVLRIISMIKNDERDRKQSVFSVAATRDKIFLPMVAVH